VDSFSFSGCPASTGLPNHDSPSLRCCAHCLRDSLPSRAFHCRLSATHRFAMAIQLVARKVPNVLLSSVSVTRRADTGNLLFPLILILILAACWFLGPSRLSTTPSIDLWRERVAPSHSPHPGSTSSCGARLSRTPPRPCPGSRRPPGLSYRRPTSQIVNVILF
jgi:hypothetical protein